MRNYPEWIIAFWAGQVVGAVVVAINAWWSPKEIALALSDSAPKVLFADGDRWRQMTKNNQRPEVPTNVITRFSGELPPSAHDWSSIVQAQRHTEMPDVDIAPEDLSTILYTSGTTGIPKGAVATHRYHSTYVMSTLYFGARGIESETGVACFQSIHLSAFANSRTPSDSLSSCPTNLLFMNTFNLWLN